MHMREDYEKKVNGNLIVLAYVCVIMTALLHLIFRQPMETVKQLLELIVVFFIPTAIYLRKKSSHSIKYWLISGVTAYAYSILYIQKGVFDNLFIFFIVIAITTLYFQIKFTVISTTLLLSVTIFVYIFFRSEFFPHVSFSNILALLSSLLITSVIVTLQTAIGKRMRLQNDTLYDKGIRDYLTDTYNRAYFDLYLHENLGKWKQENKPFSLIMIDLDDFKKVNDQFGHQTGDTVLKATTEAIKEACREDDFIARYGGEEFVLACKGAPPESIFMLAERIRMNIESRVSINDMHITASIGVSYLDEIEGDLDSFMTASRLLKLADEKLYQSKKNGKNMTTI